MRCVSYHSKTSRVGEPTQISLWKHGQRTEPACYWPQSTHPHTHTHTCIQIYGYNPGSPMERKKRESPSGRRLSNLLKNDTDCLWQHVQWKATERDRGRTHRDESPTPMSRDRSSGGVGYTPARVSLTARMTDILPLPLPPTPRSTVICGRKLWSRIASRNTNTWVNTKWVHMTCWKKKKRKKERKKKSLWFRWTRNESTRLAANSLRFIWTRNEPTWLIANSIWLTWTRNEFHMTCCKKPIVHMIMKWVHTVWCK